MLYLNDRTNSYTNFPNLNPVINMEIWVLVVFGKNKVYQVATKCYLVGIFQKKFDVRN